LRALAQRKPQHRAHESGILQTTPHFLAVGFSFLHEIRQIAGYSDLHLVEGSYVSSCKEAQLCQQCHKWKGYEEPADLTCELEATPRYVDHIVLF
jgi:hypothetical protein